MEGTFLGIYRPMISGHGPIDPRTIIMLVVPGSRYYLGSLSWTFRTFHFPDSRDLLEVLRDSLGGERGRERPQGGSPRVREERLGTPPPSLSARKVSENLEKVPGI